MAGCGSPTTTADSTATEQLLPISFVSADEGGPSSIAGLVDEAAYVLQAQLVEVRPGARYYGADEEAPDATTYEEVDLVFETVEMLEGESRGEVTIPWTAYTTAGNGRGAERLQRVSVGGLIVNERAKGQHYGIFVYETSDGETVSFTTNGLVPLNPKGKITGRTGGDPFFHDHIGEQFLDVIRNAVNS